MFLNFNKKYALELARLKIGESMEILHTLRNPKSETWKKRFKVGAVYYVKEGARIEQDLNSSNERHILTYRTEVSPAGFLLRSYIPASHMRIDQTRHSVKIQSIVKVGKILHISVKRVTHYV